MANLTEPNTTSTDVRLVAPPYELEAYRRAWFWRHYVKTKSSTKPEVHSAYLGVVRGRPNHGHSNMYSEFREIWARGYWVSRGHRHRHRAYRLQIIFYVDRNSSLVGLLLCGRTVIACQNVADRHRSTERICITREKCSRNSYTVRHHSNKGVRRRGLTGLKPPPPKFSDKNFSRILITPVTTIS